jgi:hypothetical protein
MNVTEIFVLSYLEYDWSEGEHRMAYFLVPSTVFFGPTLHQPGVYSGPPARDESHLVRNAQIRGQKKTSVTRDEELVEKKQ